MARSENPAAVEMKLAELVATFGVDRLDDTGTLHAPLSDFLGANSIALRAEISLVAAAGGEGVGRAIGDDEPVDVLSARIPIRAGAAAPRRRFGSRPWQQ